MEDYHYQKDLWHPLRGKSNKDSNMLGEDSNILDIKELGSIYYKFLVELVEFNITKEKMTKELIKTLEKLYEKPSSSNDVFIMKDFFNMKRIEGGSIYQNLNKSNTTTN